jgi:RNA polymerase sigma-70 factor (ECF subfamily)
VETVFSLPLGRQERVQEDPVWLRAAQGGETWALEQFYRSYHPAIYTLCYRLVGRAEDAQDAMQATFVRAFCDLSRFRGESAVRTWLYRIAVNEALGLLRKRREAPGAYELEVAVPGGEPAVLERLAVQAALARVKPAHRAILVLRFWEGLGYEEIALVLRISLPAVKMRLKRARDEFRKCYEDGS